MHSKNGTKVEKHMLMKTFQCGRKMNKGNRQAVAYWFISYCCYIYPNDLTKSKQLWCAGQMRK